MSDPLEAVVAGVRRGSGTVSVVLRVSGEDAPRCAIEPDAQHYAASTMKLPVLIAVQRLAERGDLDLDRSVLVHDDFDSLVPEQRFTMDPTQDSDPATWAAVGDVVPLRELVERMVTVSGNLATDLVLEQVGPAEVATVLELAGCSPRTVLPRGIEDYPARDVALDNLVTADDLARVMVALADGRLAGPGATAECERILQAQSHRAGIPAGLPPGLSIGNKTGWIDGVNHDVALVRAPGLPPIGLAVLVSAPGTPEEREAGIATIASAAWDSTMSR
ncbi:MAG: beta-lactamase class [Nocardioidaceae bacterium]|jgi:beta-lactamase class A|nr:beta-lactamase class [Nocardioidaceae bacterium]